MQYYNNILTVEASWLIDNNVMTYDNYKKLSIRKDIDVVRRACLSTPALVAYESLPSRFKKKVDALVKDPYMTAKENMVENEIENSSEAAEYYDNLMVDGDRHLPADKRREYYANAIVLNAIASIISKHNAKHSAIGGKATRFWGDLSEAVQNLDRTRYPHSLPQNARSLERRYKSYRKEGYDALVHKSYIIGNKNAAKVLNDEQRSAMLVLISDPRNLDNAQVSVLYNKIAETLGWKDISSSTVSVWRDKYEMEISALRYGATKFNANKNMQVKRQAPTYPLYYWTMDGWDVELLYQQKCADGRTTYTNRVTCVFVLDACCKYPIGYAIGSNESPALIREALRNAARHTEQLFGQMYRVAQLQTDNYAISNLTPLYKQVACNVTPAQVKNAKAKIIEPWFRYFNKKYCQMQPNWSGFGVTSRKDLQPNSDYLNKHRHSFPDLKGVIRQIEEAIEKERTEKIGEYKSRYDSMTQDQLTPLSYEDYLMIYGSTTGSRNLLQGSGLKITIDGRKHDYDCFDLHFRQHASVRWQVRYDPSDLSKVLAVNEDESLRYLLEEKYVQPMALKDRKPGDAEELERVREYNRRQADHIGAVIGDAQDHVAEMMNEQKELDVLNKLMIVDSEGQHKNRRNDARLKKDGHNDTTDEIFDVKSIYDEY